MKIVEGGRNVECGGKEGMWIMEGRRDVDYGGREGCGLSREGGM